MRNRVLMLALLLSIPAHAATAQPASGPNHWTQLTAPDPFGAWRFFDPVRSRFVLVPFWPSAREYWELRLDSPDAWQRGEWRGTGPDEARVRALVYDPRHDRLLVFARDSRHGPTGDAPLTIWGVPQDGTGEWLELANLTEPPIDRSDFTVVYDSKRQSFVLFGGSAGPPDGSPPGFSDLWRVDVQGGAALWAPLQTEGDSVTAHTR